VTRMENIGKSYARLRWAGAFLFLYGLFFIPAHFLNSDLRSFDDLSYVSHAFTLGLDQDLAYENEIATMFNKRGNLPAHPIGSGALAAPFVALFALLDRKSEHEVLVDRKAYFGSWTFFGFLFSVSFYFLLGIGLYYSALRRVCKEYGPAFNVVILLGTGLTYYVLGRFTMSHGFEFFMLSLTVYLTSRYYEALRTHGNVGAIVLGLLVGGVATLNLWIRPSNVNSLWLPFIWLLVFNRYYAYDVSKKDCALIVFGTLCGLIPYGVFNWHFYGQIFPSYATAYNLGVLGAGTPEGAFETLWYVFSLSPNLRQLLFSSEVGLIYSAPILAIGCLGILAIVIVKRPDEKSIQRWGLVFLSVLYYGFSVAIVLVWRTTASDYGYRYLFPLIPVAILFTVVLLREANVVEEKWGRRVKRLIIVFSIIGITNVFFYKVTPSLSPMEQENVYGEWHSASLKGYEMSLLRELTDYRTYILAAGKTYFGFLVAPYFLNTRLIEIVPPKIRKKFVPRFRNIPVVIYYQTGLLGIFWGIFGWYWYPGSRENETNHSTSLL
jgi:hypothetical protein